MRRVGGNGSDERHNRDVASVHGIFPAHQRGLPGAAAQAARKPGLRGGIHLLCPARCGHHQGVGATELLDYGAGKGRLGKTLREQFHLQLTIHHYDPAIPSMKRGGLTA